MEKEKKHDEKLTEVETWINKYIEEKILNAGKTDYLEKWNYFSLLYLESDDTKNKFLLGASYINDLTLNEEEKVSRILTLSYLITKEKLNITGMDVNDLYILVSYLNKENLDNIGVSLKYLNNKELLWAVRMKSLDLDIRTCLIKYVDKERKNIGDMIKFIQETDYYELVKLIS